MSWNRIRLGDIAIFRNGINFGKESYGKGVSLIGVSDFKNRFYPDYETLDEVKESVVGVNDYLDYGDIVFVRSNGNKELVGRCMLIKTTKSKITYSGFCIRTRIKNKTEHDPIFWAYHFKNISFRKSMSGNAVGTNIQNLSQGMLSNYEAEVPDYNTQLRIASILVDYDNLIENNHKQIKLLEEAAQRLYKEWFVDLRFPGHKNVEIVGGIPIGWNKCFIDDIFQIRYGKTLPTSKISNEGAYPVYGANGIIGYYNEKNCDDYTVLITSRGNGSGDVSRTHDKESFVTNNSFIVKPLNSLYRVSYVYQLMKHTDFKRVCTGSAQPQLTNTSISTIIVNKPAEEVIDLFCDRTDNLYQKIESLLRQNLFLEEARDRLLPKLMSGEIEV